MKRAKTPGSGRKPGTPNKVNKVNREHLKAILDTQSDCIKEALEKVYIDDKAKYLDFILRLVSVCIPKLEPVKSERETEEKAPTIFKFGNNKITFNGN